MITLILPTQGNPIALKRTIDSVIGVCNEVIVGDVCMFSDDTTTIAHQKVEIMVKQVMLPFNFIFKEGFSATLNLLASHASNDIVLYLNVGEIIEYTLPEFKEVTQSPEYNIWWINHAVEKHRWFRMYNRKQLKWDGLIHEEVIGDWRPFHKPVLQFGDTDKDNADLLKARCYDDIKCMVYFNQLMQIVDHPERLGATNQGWQKFAKTEYGRMETYMKEAGVRYDAFVEGNQNKYINDILTNDAFAKERRESSLLMEFQTDKKYLLHD